jgi:folate-binding Fe-S cluster repair protein YgfZ
MISGAIMLIPNRIFYKISGKDAKKFLQGITTNDMNELKPKMFSPAALLNSKGRLIAPFHVYCIDDMKEDSVFLAEIHKYFNKIFSSHLTKHKLRAKVHIEPCDHHSVYLDRNNYDDVKIGEVFRDSSNFVSRIISRNLNNESNS